MLLSTIAAAVDAVLDGEDREVGSMASLDRAGPDQLTFIAEGRPVPADLQAAAVIVSESTPRGPLPPSTVLLRTRDPYLAFARALSLFHPQPGPGFAGISPAAQVDPTAELGSEVAIAAGVSVGPGARLGDRVVLHPGVVIGAGVELGAETELMPRVVIYPHCVVGPRVRIHAGAVIGADGFGYAPSPGGAVKIPHVGRVVIEADVEIGANTTIDRGVLDDTVIGTGTKIDNLVQIGHNCRVGAHCLLAGQVGLAGSSSLGNGVLVGGQAGLGGHLHVGDGAQIGGQSGVHRDVPPGARYLGSPATDLRTARRALAILYKLPELREHVERISRRLESVLGEE